MKQLVEDVMASCADPTLWDRALNSFNEVFGITASCMFSVHEFRDLRLNFAWSQYHRTQMQPDVLEMMQAGGDGGDAPGYETLLRLPAQTLYDEPALFQVDGYGDLPPSNVRSITEGHGFVMRCAAALNQNGPWIDGLFCQHKSDREWRGFLADGRVQIILPMMASGVALGRTLGALRARYQASLSVLDALGLAVFLVDHSGSVIERNTAAQRILDDADGLSVSRQNHVKLSGPERTSELETMIEAANGLARGNLGAARTVLSCARPSGRYDYLLSVRALSDVNAELETGLKCAFVTVIDPARQQHLSVEGLKELAQLSDAEGAVAALLVEGLKIAEVAERRNVSPNTIKAQLKSISQKLRCSSQSDIIRMAASTRIPLNDPDHPNG